MTLKDWYCDNGSCKDRNVAIEDCAAKPGKWIPYTEGCPEGYECQAYYKYTCSAGGCVLKDTPEQRRKRCDASAAWIADPVDPATGEFMIVETDLVIPGRGFDYQFVRSYSSQGDQHSPLGYNWDHNYNIRLTRPSADTLIMSNGPAEIISYYALEDSTYRSTLNYYSIITENGDGTFTSRTPDGLSAHFVAFDGSATAGKLARIVDGNGNTMRFTYDSNGRLITVMDTLGRLISYQYDAADHLAAIVDFSGRRVLFQYDERGDLVAVTRPAHTPGGQDRTTKYTYSTGFADPRLNHNLLTVTNPSETTLEPDGPPAVVNTYETNPDSYAFDRVIQQEINSAGSGCCGFGGVGRVTLSYELLDPSAGIGDMNTARTRTVVTDSLGNVTEYYHNAVGGLLRTVQKPQTGLASSTTALVTEYTYNYNAEQAAVTYPEGNRVEYTYDEVNPDRLQQANLLREDDIPDPDVGGEPLVTTYAYEPVFNQVISETNPAEDTTTYTYDDSGNRTAITDALGYTITLTYDESGTQTGQTDANGNETIIDDYYLAPPVPSFIITPTWGPTHTVFLFDASPSWDVEDASADLQVRWDWEDDGQYDTPYTTVKTATHQYLTYGPRTVRLEVLDSDHLTATATSLVLVRPYLTYLPLITKGYTPSPAFAVYLPLILKGGGTIASALPGPPTLSAVALSWSPPSVEFEVPTSRSVASASSITYRRTVTTTNALGYVTTQVYDAYDNLIEEMDANGHTTRYRYDTFNQLVTVTDDLGYTTHYEYDLNGNRTRVIDANGNSTYYEYDMRNLLVAITDTMGGVTRYTYDANGNMTGETDANGNTTAYEYDEFNRLIKVTDPLGAETVYIYDANGNRTSETDANGNTTTYEYDGHDRLIRQVDAEGKETLYVYDELGNTVVITDANGHTRRFQYDALSRLTKEWDGLGNPTEYAYDGVGNMIAITDALGRVTTHAYDAVNRLITTTDAADYTTINAYDPVGNRIAVTDGNGHSTRYNYDALNRLITFTNPLNEKVAYVYDAVGNLTALIDPLGRTTTYEYDTLNRLITVTDPLNQQTVYAYDAVGNQVLVRDANGNETHYGYDAEYRATSITDARGYNTQFGYDAVGNRTVITDANGHAYTFGYDAGNRLVWLADPLSYTTVFTYDGVGNLVEKTDAKGQTLAYTYDAADRQTSLAYPDGTVISRTYDAVGNLLTLTDPNTGLRFEYDVLNRTTVITDAVLSKVITYSYDGVGNRIAMGGPEGSLTTYDYDNANRVTEIAYGADAATYAYDAAGRLLTRTLPNGVSVTYAYDDSDRLLELANRRADGAVLSRFAYDLDAVGNRTAITMTQMITPGLTFTDVVAYGYDATYQLTSETRTGNISYTQQFVYDPAGNRIQLITNGQVISYTYDVADRLLAEWGARNVDYGWDANGNLITTTTGLSVTTYAYDYEDQLVEVTGPGVAAVYEYDPFGRRTATHISGVTTCFLYDGADLGTNVLAEYDGGGALAALYLNGLGIDQNITKIIDSNSYTYLHDGLGSVRGLADATAAAVNRYDYEAFGNQLTAVSGVPNAYTFTGRRWDGASGLYYYRTRYYDAMTGRFTQEDKLFVDVLMAENTSRRSIAQLRMLMPLYAYVGNDPANNADPLGSCRICEWILERGSFSWSRDIRVSKRINLIVKKIGLSGGVSIAVSGKKINPCCVTLSVNLQVQSPEMPAWGPFKWRWWGSGSGSIKWCRSVGFSGSFQVCLGAKIYVRTPECWNYKLEAGVKAEICGFAPPLGASIDIRVYALAEFGRRDGSKREYSWSFGWTGTCSIGVGCRGQWG